MLADFRALPGMEGGPVFDGSGALVGMTTVPLCICGYELPVVIPSAALASAVAASLQGAQSVSPQPACSMAAGLDFRSGPLPAPQDQQRQQQSQQRQWRQQAEAAAQLERSPCSAAMAEALPVAVPAISAPTCDAAQHVAALLRAARGVVGCSLSSGQWASGVLVNRYPGD